MIIYDPGKWGLIFALSLRGSVFPKAFAFAAPCSVLSLTLHFMFHYWVPGIGARIGADDVATSVLSGFTFVLGFLVVFRSQQAYSRWWEGGTLLQQLRGEWFNAYSSLLAFCNTSKDPEVQFRVRKFQHQLVRLISLLYGSALQQVAQLKENVFELIEVEGFEREHMLFMQDSHDKCEVVLQWTQRLIVEAYNAETIKIAPPILSRVYNELGNGIVNLNNARKITDFPIPFPLAQMITFMLVFHWFATAVVCATSVEHAHWAGLLSFIVIFSYWCINFIALELEMPFGDDPNDLPLVDMQIDLNKSLRSLMHERACRPPHFDYGDASHGTLSLARIDFDGDIQAPVVAEGERRRSLPYVDAVLQKISCAVPPSVCSPAHGQQDRSSYRPPRVSKLNRGATHMSLSGIESSSLRSPCSSRGLQEKSADDLEKATNNTEHVLASAEQLAKDTLAHTAFEEKEAKWQSDHSGEQSEWQAGRMIGRGQQASIDRTKDVAPEHDQHDKRAPHGRDRNQIEKLTSRIDEHLSRISEELQGITARQHEISREMAQVGLSRSDPSASGNLAL
jgi:putative membrane protein